MSIVQFLLLNVPTYILGAIIVAAFLVFAVGGLFIIRAFIPFHRVKPHNDVAGFIFATIGVIYAVLLAFMVIVAWQAFDQANSNLVKEANYLGDLARDAVAFPPAFQVKVNSAVLNYMNASIEEWPLLARGEWSPKVQKLSGNLYRLYANFTPRTETEKIFLAESVQKRNQAGELRRLRLYNARSGIHPILWFVLIAGGLITIAFTMFFGTENFLPHLMMSSLLAILIALVLFTIMAMDFPFAGDVAIKPEPFETVKAYLFSK